MGKWDHLITGVTAKGIPGKPDDLQPFAAGPGNIRPRAKGGRMNKTEADYAADLEVSIRCGHIRGWWWTPGSLRLSDPDPTTGRADYYRPDFLVWRKDGRLEYVEIKGHLEDDARTKFKVAQTRYPCFRFTMLRKEKGVGFVIVMGGGEET